MFDTGSTGMRVFSTSLRGGRIDSEPSGVDLASFQAYSVEVEHEPDDSAYWAQTIFPWCYQLVNAQFSFSACSSRGVLTDTGGNAAHFLFGAAAPPGFQQDGLTQLPPDVAFTATLGSSSGTGAEIRWAFETGTCPQYNAPSVWFGRANATPPPGAQSSNGINPYFMNEVLYDLEGGHIGFRPVVDSPPSSCNSSS